MLPTNRHYPIQRTYAKGNYPDTEYTSTDYYLSRDTVHCPNKGWQSYETAGEYKYIIYFFVAKNEGDSSYNVDNWKNSDDKFEFKDRNGKVINIYTNGELAEIYRNYIDAIDNYDQGFTFKYCGWKEIDQAKWDEIYKRNKKSINQIEDIYGTFEVDGNGDKNYYSYGKDKNGNYITKERYSDHHFSIIITGNGGFKVIPVFYPTSTIASVHFYINDKSSPDRDKQAVQHEVMHSLGFGHKNDNSKNYEMVTGNNTYQLSPFGNGTFLNHTISGTNLDFNDDSIHGIDILFDVPEKPYHLTIKGDVELTGSNVKYDLKLGTNGYYGLVTDIEVERNNSGQITGSSLGYIGVSYIFLVEDDSNELYYQSPVDKNGYFEFKIRIPNRYKNAVTGRYFSLFFVSSHFYMNYLSHERSLKIPIFWHRTPSIKIPSTISLPYTFDLTNDNLPSTSSPYGKIKVKNTTYATYFNVYNYQLTGTDLYENLERDSRIRIIYNGSKSNEINCMTGVK